MNDLFDIFTDIPVVDDAYSQKASVYAALESIDALNAERDFLYGPMDGKIVIRTQNEHIAKLGIAVRIDRPVFGQLHPFQLHASPNVTCAWGKRTPTNDPARWLRNHVRGASVQFQMHQSSWKKCSKAHGFPIFVCNYVGILRVDDVAVFWHGMFHGFGRCRAFGCGLLLLKTQGPD